MLARRDIFTLNHIGTDVKDVSLSYAETTSPEIKLCQSHGIWQAYRKRRCLSTFSKINKSSNLTTVNVATRIPRLNV